MNEKKIIVITGASEGLGAAIADALKSNQHKIWLLARSKENLNKVRNKLLNEGFSCEIIQCNLANESQIIQSISQIIDSDKKIDILINNAGVWTETDIEEIKLEEIKNSFNVNVFGLILITGKVISHMKERASGTILNVISTSAIDAEADWPVYVSTKFAVKGFSQSLKKKYSKEGLRIIDFFPTGINTNFYKNAGVAIEPNQSWMIDKNEIANIIKYLVEFPQNISIDNVEVRKI